MEQSSPATVPARPPTIYDVAKRAGVSSQTVVRYLHGFEGMTTLTRSKVQGAIDVLDYRPNRFARALRTGESRRILLFVHELSEAGPANLILAAQEAASAAGHVLEIIALDVHDLERTARIVRETDRSHVAGAIALAPTPEIARIFDAMPPEIPLLREINGDGLEGDAYQGVPDAGARMQIEHLHVLGHRSVFLLGGPEGWYSSERRAATASATATALGMRVAGQARGDWSAASGYAAIQDGAGVREATAVVAANDEMATGALLALHEAGLRVPERMSVVGYDDIRTAAFQRPPLSTIRNDFATTGRAAVQRMLALIDRSRGLEPTGPDLEPAPHALVARGSTGPAPW